MDITDALAPTSDQLDAIELVNPRTFTIDTGSRLGSRDGKTVAEIRLVDFPRVWRPSKGMLDVLARCWGTDGKAWAGRSVTLYNDPDVTFGKDKVGGIRISHLSHIDGPVTVMIRGRGQGARKIAWPVQPLAGALADPTATQDGLLTDHTRATMFALLTEQGITDADAQRAGMSHIIGRSVESRSTLTEGEGLAIIDHLRRRAAAAGALPIGDEQ